jgi:hypothetical protein
MEDNQFSEDILKSINEQLAESAEKARRLKAEADRAAAVQQVWENLLSYVNRQWYLHILHLLKKNAVVFNELRDADPSVATALEEISRTAELRAEILTRRFPKFIEDACAQNNLPLDRESRHPKYKFNSGFFQLDIDERSGIAKLWDNEGLLEEFPGDIGAVVEAVQRERKRIFERPFDGNKFLAKLRRQYLEIVKNQNELDGANIPIRKITTRLGKNEKGFRTDEFIVDLSRLIMDGPSEIDGARFDLQQTKNTKQGMLLLGNAGRGYIGFISFRRD